MHGLYVRQFDRFIEWGSRRVRSDETLIGECDIPTPGSGARAIVGASDGRLFFSQHDIGCIGEVRP